MEGRFRLVMDGAAQQQRQATGLLGLFEIVARRGVLVKT